MVQIPPPALVLSARMVDGARKSARVISRSDRHFHQPVAPMRHPSPSRTRVMSGPTYLIPLKVNSAINGRQIYALSFRGEVTWGRCDFNLSWDGRGHFYRVEMSIPMNGRTHTVRKPPVLYRRGLSFWLIIASVANSLCHHQLLMMRRVEPPQEGYTKVKTT